MDEQGGRDPPPSVVSSVERVSCLSPVSPDAERSCPVVVPPPACPLGLTGSFSTAESVSVRVIVSWVARSIAPPISMIHRVIFFLIKSACSISSSRSSSRVSSRLAQGSEHHNRPKFKISLSMSAFV